MSFREWLISIIARSEQGSDLRLCVINSRSELGSDLDWYYKRLLLQNKIADRKTQIQNHSEVTTGLTDNAHYRLYVINILIENVHL